MELIIAIYFNTNSYQLMENVIIIINVWKNGLNIEIN
jgi:hypothetical protein